MKFTDNGPHPTLSLIVNEGIGRLRVLNLWEILSSRQPNKLVVLNFNTIESSGLFIVVPGNTGPTPMGVLFTYQ